MTEYFTDAPVLVVRPIASFAGCGFYPAGIGEPAWVETVLEGRGNALNMVIQSLFAGGYKVEPEGRPAISNPVFAIASANTTREGGSSAPAARYAHG